MKPVYVIALSAGLILNLNAQDQVVAGKMLTKNQYVCYGSEEVRKIYIPPPEQFSQGKGSKTANIEAVYFGFPEYARDAVQYAVNIWASLLKSDVKIRISFTWTSMAESSTLGTSSSGGYYRGSYIGAMEPDVFYSIALAEKIAGKELNEPSDYEITIKLNSLSEWYFGLDGQTLSSKYDLVTVVLHELCHGFGFADSFYTSETLGYYGFSGIPVIYDKFIEDALGKKLTDTRYYSNPSAELRNALLSGSLYFSAPLTLNYAHGRQAIYAPGVWSSGSSISHLSESATPQADALMTPFIGKGEAIHDPGKLTLSILGDLGWINTRIMHTELPDTEDDSGLAVINVSIDSDTLLKKNGIRIFYRFNDAATWDSVVYSIDGKSGSINHNLFIPSYNTLTSYYIAVSDTFGRVFNAPSAGAAKPFSFYAGEDTVYPVIEHTPDRFILSTLDTMELKAKISDNIYPVDAKIEYRLNNGPHAEIIMDSRDGKNFTAHLPLIDFDFNVSDTIYYRLIATDGAARHNTAFSPSGGYHKVAVYNLFEPVEYYFTSFNSGEGDFLLDGFTVSVPTGFANPSLNSRHPYQSPDKDGGSVEYIALLRYPIVTDHKGLLISYREIVLVEPGEADSKYGSDDFYDYVVIEGSADGGRTWIALTDGYDSRADAGWLTTYNSSFVGMNSTAVGTPDMYRKRIIEFKQSPLFSVADAIAIRFRLYSDPYANGWGWSVDDLFIKGMSLSAEKVPEVNMSLYPNPGNGLLTIHFPRPPGKNGYRVTISDYSGKTVKHVDHVTDEIFHLDISDLPQGVYTVISEQNRLRIVSRYILVK